MTVSLRDMLASEEFCGLRYNQKAIEKFITDNVPADNIGFATSLGSATRIQKRKLNTFASSGKTAYYVQTKRAVRTLDSSSRTNKSIGAFRVAPAPETIILMDQRPLMR